MEGQHILLLGATGASGLCFIDRALSLLPTPPFLTLYIRRESRSKLPSIASSHPRVHIVEGSLADAAALHRALEPASSFPKVTAVVSVLGAYMSLSQIFTRAAPTPIADAFRSTIIPAMKEANVSRIFVLSTPSGFPLQGEYESADWMGWLLVWVMPGLVVPQGKAEMRGIAMAVVDAGNRDQGLEYTVFRVPHLVGGVEGEGGEQVVAGTLGRGYQGGWDLTRASMCRWVLREIVERKWVRGAPFLGNM